MSVARVAQVLSDNGLQAEAFIQLADQNQASVGGDAGSLKRDLQKPVECELKGLGFFLTHRVSPPKSGSARKTRRNTSCTRSSTAAPSS